MDMALPMTLDRLTPDAPDPLDIESMLRAGKKVWPDVTQVLMEDHRTVLRWFADYAAAVGQSQKRLLRDAICLCLRAHMVAEETVLYAAAEKLKELKPLAERARIEHEEAKALVLEIERKLDDKAMAELGKAIAAHVLEEESEFFPKVRAANLPLHPLGATLFARRVETLQRLAEAQRARQEPADDTLA